MDTFEYRLLSVEQDAHALVDQLNRMGAQGWEAVTQVSADDEDDPVPGAASRARYLLLQRRSPADDADTVPSLAGVQRLRP